MALTNKADPETLKAFRELAYEKYIKTGAYKEDAKEAIKRATSNSSSAAQTNANKFATETQNAFQNTSSDEIAKNVVMSGMGTFNKGLMATLDFILPTEFLGKYDFISNLNDYYSQQDGYWKQEKEKSLEGKSTTTKIAANVGEGTVAALPNAILALMSAGTSMGGQALGTTASAGSGVISSIGNTARTMIKNPTYWTSMAQTLGTDYEEAKANGANEFIASSSAIIKSALNAGIEIGGGIETLPQNIKNGNSKLITEWVKSMVDEGKEEVIQGIVSNSVDKLMYDYNKDVLSLENENAIINPQRMTKEFGMGAAVGGVLGGVQTGVVAGVNARNNNINKKINSFGEKYSENIDDVIESGLASDENSKAHQIALTLNDKRARGENITNAEISRLVIETQKEIVKEPDIIEKTAIDIVTERMKNEPTQKPKRENITLYEDDDYILKSETKNGETIYSLNTKKGESPLDIKGATKEIIKKELNSYIKLAEYGNNTEAAKIWKNMLIKLDGDNTDIATAENLEALTQGGYSITVEEAEKASGFGKKGAELLSDIVNNTDGVTFNIANRAMKTAYLAGFTGADMKKVEFATELQQKAFDAGNQDRAMQDALAKERAKNATVYDGGLIENKQSKKLSPKSREIISIFAKDFGTSTEITDRIVAAIVNGKEYEANAEHTDGRIRGSLSSEKPVLKWVLHENGHRMEQFATDEWNRLANALYERAERLGRRTKTNNTDLMEFDKVKHQHDNAGITMSTNAYIGEVAVRELETIFSSEKEFLKWRNELDANPQLKSAWQKFWDWVLETIRDIKWLIDNRKLSKEARAEARAELKELEHIKELYADAYKATKKAVEDRTAEVNFDNTLDLKTKKGYNENINYSLKDTTKDNSAFDIDSVPDKSDYIGYVPIKKVKMKTFPPYNESKSDANEWATRWAHREDVETGAQTLVFYHNRCYVIGKYDSADLKYQIDGRISYSAYESIRKELEEDARNREKQSQKKMVDFLRERNEQRNTDEGRGQSTDYSSVEHGREDRDILRLGRKQDGKRDVSSNISRSDEYDFKDRQTKSLNEGKNYSLKDQEYLELAKNPEQNEARLNAMVYEVAKEAGYTERVYHGTTGFGFTKVNVRKSDDGISFFATDSLELAQTYSGVSGLTPIKGNKYSAENKQKYDTLVSSFVDKINEIAGKELLKINELPFDNYLNKIKKGIMNIGQLSIEMTNYTFDVIEKLENDKRLSVEEDKSIWDMSTELETALYGMNGKSGNYGLYADTDGFFVVDGKGANWSSIPFDKIPSKTTANTREIVKWAKENGYTGVLFKNIYDIGTQVKTQKTPANVYAFLNPQEQVKSADPVTYNAFGRMIPLSKRFNTKNDDIRYSLKEDFTENYDSWVKKGRKDGVKLQVGTTSKALQSIGVKDQNITWDSSKINGSLKKHQYLDDGTMKQIPEILENPIIVMQSKKSDSRLTMFGEVYDNDGLPIMAVLELLPTNNNETLILDEIKVVSTHSRKTKNNPTSMSQTQNIINTSDILYIEPNKKRTDNWLVANRLQLPLHITNYGSIKSITYPNGNVNSYYMKNSGNNSDLNQNSYSLKDNEVEAPSKRTKELLDTIEHLQNEFKLTKFAKADPKKLDTMTRSLLREYNSKLGFEETRQAIEELYSYMANGKNKNQPAVWDEVYSRAKDIATKIVESAVVKDDSDYRTYKELRSYLKNTGMYIDPHYSDDLGGYENLADFRRRNFNRIKLVNDPHAIGVDSAYSELSSMYPEYFDESITNEADQLLEMANVLDSLQPMEYNPFDGNVESATVWIANDIIDRFFDVPQAKPTFADKAERRVIEANIKGFKKVEKVRAEKNAKIEKLMKANAEKTKERMKKVRAERDEAIEKEKQKNREKISKMSENQKNKVLRTQITRHANELSQKLLNPTDNKHIPQDLQGVVAKLLECINLESNYSYDMESHSYKKNDDGLPTRRTKAFNELRNLYAKKSGELTIDPDLLGEDGLLHDVIELADKRIVDMNSEELTKIWETLRAVETSITTANKLFSEGKFAKINEISEALREDNKGKKGKAEFKSVLGKIQKLTTLDMLNLETYLHYLGETGDEIFRMMRNADDEQKRIMAEVANFTNKTTSKISTTKLEEEIHTVKLGGKDVKLTTAQLMELYVLMKREKAVEHILTGGILPDIIETKGIKNIAETEPIRNIAIEEIDFALSKLTDEQKEVADKMQKFVSTTLSEYGNDASMKVYNYKKFTEPNYWSIRTNKQEIASDVSKDTAITTVANQGFTKSTKPNVHTSIRVGSIFDTFSKHSLDMAKYSAWLGASEDINKIRNFVFWEDGEISGTVKGILDTVHGRNKGSEYLQKMMTDIAIGVQSEDNMSPLTKLTGNYKAASVGANLRVILQQPTAILRALDMINPIYLIQGIGHPLQGWEKAKKYAPIAQWKAWGYFDINTGRQMKDVFFNNAKLGERVKQLGFSGASMADSLAWGQLWNAVEAETKAKHKELEVGSDAYYKAVAKRFTEIVDHTQVVDGILQRNQIMRSGDSLTKMATSFMSEPVKQYNMVMSAVYDTINGKGDVKKKAFKRLGRTTISLAIAGIVNAAMQSIIDAMRDDDEERKYWDKWLESFEDNLLDLINPLAYVPFIKDIGSIIGGYDIERMDTETISKTVSAVKNMYKAITGEGKYTIAEASAVLFAEIGRLYGIPIANVKRDVKAMVMTTAIQTDNYLMQYRIEKSTLNMNYKSNSKTFMDILFNAYNNDKNAYDIIYKDLLNSGYDSKKIKDAMDDRMKKAENVKEVDDLKKRWVPPEIQKQYDNGLKQIETSRAWQRATDEQKKDARTSFYDFLASDSETMKELREKTKKYDIDATEYALYKLALDIVDKPNKNGKKGTYTNAEKDAAFALIGLGSKERKYFKK